jgi:pimeloyl-ACP methyl ester carboxylesterase
MIGITPDQLPLKYRLLRRGLQALSYTAPPLAARVSFDMFSTPTRRPVRSGKTRRVLDRATVETLPYTDPDIPAFADLSVTVRTWGDPANPRVLLAHGWEGQAGSFREFIPSLVEAGLYVVAFDAPGHGTSDGKRANLLVFINTVRAVTRGYGPFHAAIGHSLGGIAALLASAEPPQIEVGRLVLIAAPKHVTGAFEAFTHFWGLPERTRDDMYRLVSDAIGRSVGSFTVERVADDVTQPVLLVHDHDDADVSFSDATDAQAMLPNADLYATDGLGHQMILRDADVVARVVDFVRPSTAS